MCSGYGIAFDRTGSWSFSNDLARNIVIFGVDRSSSSHTNRKNNFLVLVEGPTDDINGSVGTREKTFSINVNFGKVKTKFCLSLHYNGDNNNLFVKGKGIFKFMPIINMSTFQLSFV